MREKYDNAFKQALDIESVDENLKYGDQKWDSIAHMTLVSQLEEAFQFQMETDDIIGLSSYKMGLEVLKKYGISEN